MSSQQNPSYLSQIFSPANLIQIVSMCVVAMSIFFNTQSRLEVIETKLTIMKQAYDSQFQELKEQRAQDLTRFEKSVDKLTDRIEKLTAKIDAVQEKQANTTLITKR